MRTARKVCRCCPSRRVAIVILGSRRRTSTEARYVKTSTIVVVQLLSDLETTIQEGVEAKRLHKSSLNGVSRKRVILHLMYRTEQEDRADLVEELGATSEAFRTKIDDFVRSVATSDADLKAASAIRKKERRVCE